MIVLWSLSVDGGVRYKGYWVGINTEEGKELGEWMP